MEQSVERTEWYVSWFSWWLRLFKNWTSFSLSFEEILKIFTFNHIIYSYTQEFIAALNRFFFPHNFSSGSCVNFPTFLKTALIVLSSACNDGIFLFLWSRRRKVVRKLLSILEKERIFTFFRRKLKNIYIYPYHIHRNLLQHLTIFFFVSSNFSLGACLDIVTCRVK